MDEEELPLESDSYLESLLIKDLNDVDDNDLVEVDSLSEMASGSQINYVVHCSMFFEFSISYLEMPLGKIGGNMEMDIYYIYSQYQICNLNFHLFFISRLVIHNLICNLHFISMNFDATCMFYYLVSNFKLVCYSALLIK